MEIHKKTLAIGIIAATLIALAICFALSQQGEYQGNMFRLNRQGSSNTNSQLKPNGFAPETILPGGNNGFRPDSSAGTNRFEPDGI